VDVTDDSVTVACALQWVNVNFGQTLESVTTPLTIRYVGVVSRNE